MDDQIGLTETDDHDTGATEAEVADDEESEVEEPVILESAFRHGVTEEDMLHALRNESHHVVQEDGMVMFVGPDKKGSLIEVGVLEWFGILAIAHAMRPARDKYLRSKNGR